MHASPSHCTPASWLAQRGAPILCASALLAAIGCPPADGRPEGLPVPSSQLIAAAPTYAPPPGLYPATPSPDRQSRPLGNGSHLVLWLYQVAASGDHYGDCDFAAQTCTFSAQANGFGFIENPSRP